jgi:putative flippase GtrA
MFGISRPTIIQFLKFNLVGITNTFLAAVVYVIVAHLSGSYTLGLIADYAFGIVFGFIINKLFTFENKDEPVTVKQVAKYVVVYGFVFSINYSLLRLAVESYGYGQYLSQFVIFVVIVVPLFFVQKKYVFVDKESVQ